MEFGKRNVVENAFCFYKEQSDASSLVYCNMQVEAFLNNLLSSSSSIVQSFLQMYRVFGVNKG